MQLQEERMAGAERLTLRGSTQLHPYSALQPSCLCLSSWVALLLTHLCLVWPSGLFHWFLETQWLCCSDARYWDHWGHQETAPEFHSPAL